MKCLLIITFLCLFVAVNEAKIFKRCDLARILNQHGLHHYSGYNLDNWVCMAYHESRYNSRAVGRPNSDGSREYGIFQINSRNWCSNGEGQTSNGCSSSCNAFIDDNITDDINCTKRIVQEPDGMNAWNGWVTKCKGRDMSSYTRGCRL